MFLKGTHEHKNLYAKKISSISKYFFLQKCIILLGLINYKLCTSEYTATFITIVFIININ